MPTAENTVRKKFAELGEELQTRAWTIGRDRRSEAWTRRRWAALEGLFTIAFSLVARRAAARAWGVLTGELPPARR